jgi:murein DD-endopeptidase MepM/ murein hydrolase activator NlpD
VLEISYKKTKMIKNYVNKAQGVASQAIQKTMQLKDAHWADLHVRLAQTPVIKSVAHFMASSSLDKSAKINPTVKAIAPAIDWLGQYVPVRQRYILTRENKLRLRYALPCIGGFTAFALTTIVSFSSSSSALQIEDYSFINRMAQIEPASGVASEKYNLSQHLQTSNRRLQRYLTPRDGADDAPQATEEAPALKLASFQPRMIPQPREEVLEIGKGDTLAAVLQRSGVSGKEAHEALSELRTKYDPRQLKAGQNVYLRMDPVSPENSEEYRMTHLSLPIDPFQTVAIKRTQDGFEAGLLKKKTERRVYARQAPIQSSLYGSASKAGIPNKAIAEVIRILSYDVDFGRDVRKGDDLSVMYDQMETDDGRGVKFGNVIFAKLRINGVEKPVYRYELKNGDVDYYTEDGKSVRKSLLQTPIDGARVSSNFGMRNHPVLGYSKMHKGTDFAAPTGTPIYAAGDGVIEMAARHGAYGNYVRIRHTGGIKTAYAHLSKYGKGISNGTRVKQGQVIGYVGATGRVTGAHLHYEVLQNGKHINPRSMKLPTGDALKGNDLAAFKSKVGEINRQYAELVKRGDSVKVASSDTKPE